VLSVAVIGAAVLAPAASAAIVIQFNKTNAQPGTVVRATTAMSSVPLPPVAATGARWYLFLVRVDFAPTRGTTGVFRVAPLGVTASGSAYATFRVPNARGSYYTPAIGCRSCPNRRLILGGEHNVRSAQRDILRIFRVR
jgi:hypothetical protein